jgi:hypothetical protein
MIVEAQRLKAFGGQNIKQLSARAPLNEHAGASSSTAFGSESALSSPPKSPRLNAYNQQCYQHGAINHLK